MHPGMSLFRCRPTPVDLLMHALNHVLYDDAIRNLSRQKDFLFLTYPVYERLNPLLPSTLVRFHLENYAPLATGLPSEPLFHLPVL